MNHWQALRTPSGVWIWSRPLSNGWTAWVMDFGRPGSTLYHVSASADGGTERGGKSVFLPRPVKEFGEAKSLALSIALAQSPYLDRTYKISARRNTL